MRRVLFVCVGNSCRSPMAAALAQHHARRLGLELEVASAGTSPAERVHPHAVAAMREVGLQLKGHRPVGAQAERLDDWDCAIFLGGAHEGPPPGVRHLWGLPDPLGQPLEAYRRVRDEIEVKVLALLEAIAGQHPPQR